MMKKGGTDSKKVRNTQNNRAIRIYRAKMTQEERWQQQYEQMMSFMETNQRRPSKYRLEEHDMLNWFKATKKRVAKGELSEERLKKFNVLLEVAEKYRRLNQYK